MARNAYAYSQLVMIGGIILFALGAEEIVRQIADRSINLVEPTHGPGVPLLFGGVICYLCGGMLFQLRTLGTLSWTRVGTVLLLAVAIPLATHLPALAALSLLTAICIGLVAAEVAVMADARRALLKAVFEEKTTYEKHEADWAGPLARRSPGRETPLRGHVPACAGEAVGRLPAIYAGNLKLCKALYVFQGGPERAARAARAGRLHSRGGKGLTWDYVDGRGV